jgi:hypothetical protein
MGRGKFMRSALLDCLHFVAIPLTYKYTAAYCGECGRMGTIIEIPQ